MVIKHMQGCITTEPLFKLIPANDSVAGPSSGAIYQALAAAKPTASALSITKQERLRSY
ncbi:MAG TPA: hypothetical protein VFI70_05735 [Nitrososphaeraceae archaeon]|nr:hypothetical protein [Nitrososphaeraceae archaeon]